MKKVLPDVDDMQRQNQDCKHQDDNHQHLENLFGFTVMSLSSFILVRVLRQLLASSR